MPPRLLDTVLIRAPLLPCSARNKPAAKVFADPLARAALGLASRDLRDGPASARKAAALANYVSRAAFRPTPHGLWAGVAIGELGPSTAIATGKPRAHVTVSWGRLCALGRALLDDPAQRDEVRLRSAPSLLRDRERAHWLDFGEAACAVERVAELDDRLDAVLTLCERWRTFAEVRATAAQAGDTGHASFHGDGDAAALDEYLLALVDDGLLVHDLTPPLVGPPPLEWTRVRLGGRLPALDLLPGLLADTARPIDQRLDEARALLATLPGAGGKDDEPLHAVLVHESVRAPRLSRAAVERAASLASLLFRLQQALVPPAAERALDPAMEEAFTSVSEVFGAGALDLGALARGEYGIAVGGESDASLAAAAPDHALLRHLVDRLVASARDQQSVLALSSVELEPLLPGGETPGTFELFLSPMQEPRGARPGSGWLLGLHAPAGASFGRFAEALGGPLASALETLAECERMAVPSENRLDVSFAPSRALGDLALHPPARRAALALSAWPAGPAVTPEELSLVVDDAALSTRALRHRERPVAPSPLSRLRSTTAPPGVFRLLAGWSLYRQHAPWALQLGALADLPRVPRVELDGFVIAPASWRLPASLTPAGLRAWRKQAGVPRHVQVGRQDELLLVDLDAPRAAHGLARLAADPVRAYEVWPPLDAGVDHDGRRIEAVVMVVDEPEAELAAHLAAAHGAIATAGPVPPPRLQPAAEGWRTYKIFGAPDRADRVIAGALWPLAQGARAAEAPEGIDGWFFLRYTDGPGARDHVRLRVLASDDVRHARFAADLEQALAPARAAGDVVGVEVAPYYRELARYGRDAMPAVESLFEADSELACALILGDADDSPSADGTELLVRTFDALALELGLDLPARRALARRRRMAHDDLLRDVDGGDRLSSEHRARQGALQGALTASLGPPFDRYAARVAALAPALPRAGWEALLPPLLHLSAVRLAGRREEEARAYYFWERTLDGLVARALRSRR